MAAATNIEWTDRTWNPVTGCDKVSDGCRNCYAETMAHRLQLMDNPRYANGFQVTLHHDLLTLPHRWRKPRKIFVNSMSDLLHKDVPDDFIAAVLETIAATPRHIYQVLTKRPHRALAMADALAWPPNLWLGVQWNAPATRSASGSWPKCRPLCGSFRQSRSSKPCPIWTSNTWTG